jgi:GT2 family glycosyltransferase
MSDLRCSVIVPSYNRRATLEMVLEGLAHQTLPVDQFEVIVVLDGSTDDSIEMLTEWQRSGRLPHLRSHLQPNSGQATARNTGAQLAASPVLLFLDDDVVPDPDLVATHVRHHARGQPLAVLGDCLVVRERQDSLYHLGVWSWWEDTYHERAKAGRQPGLRDFCAGNVSLRRDDWLAVGGFDPAFRGYGGEDFELGYRLLRSGVRFVSDRAARARHYHRTTVAGVLRATRQEGLGDVLLGRMHPELRSGLRLMTIPNDRYGLLVRTAILAPALGDLLMTLLGAALPLWERLRMRRRWQAYFNHMRGYAYWRGVRDALGSWRALRAYQAEALAQPHIELDITDGLPAHLPPLWIDGPSTIRIVFCGQEIGTLRIENAITQPVRQHLAEAIVTQLGDRLAQVLLDDKTRSSPDTRVATTQAAA